MKHQDRAFFQLYGDAIWHAHYALEFDKVESRVASQKATRASIIASAIALECASNCVLDHLDVSKRLRDNLDKLTPLSKFEMVARAADKPFEFGDARVAAMNELVKLRNDYAHPKVTNIPVEMSSFAMGDTHHELELSFDGKLLTNLGVDRNSKFWFPEGARSVLEKSTNFYNWYFIDCLGQSTLEVLGTLGPLLFLDDALDNARPFPQDCILEELNMLSGLGITNNFLDLAAADPATEQEST